MALAAALVSVFVAFWPSRQTTLRVGFCRFAPFMDGPEGAPAGVGFAPAVLAQAARRAGIRIQWVRIPSNPAKALRDGAIDLFPIALLTPERQAEFHASHEWWEFDPVIVSKASFGDLRGGSKSIRRVGALRLKLMGPLISQYFPAATVVPYRGFHEFAAALCSGEIDAFAVEGNIADAILLEPRSADCGSLRRASLAAGTRLLGTLASPRVAPEADRIFNQLTELSLSGDIAETAARYGLALPHASVKQTAPFHRRLAYLVWFLAGGALFVLIALNWWHLRRTMRAENSADSARRVAAETEERLRLFMESVPGVVYIKDSLGEILSVNGAAAADSESRSLIRGIAAQLKTGDEAVLAEGKPLQAVEAVVTPAGETRQWLTQKFRFRSVSGAYLLGGTAVDVTDRETAQFLLKQSEERFRVLFEQAPVAMHEVDAQGVIRRVNAMECKLLDCAEGDLLGRYVWETVNTTDREASRQSVAHKLSGKLPLVPFTRRLDRFSDGRPVVVEIHENFITDANGAIIGLRSCLLDVTERELHTRQLREYAEQLAIARDAAEAATRAKGEFLATMSHEIRTPLNGIVGMTSLLSDSDLSEEQMEFVDVITRCSESLLHIINDILDFSKIDAGRLELDETDFDLKGVIEESVEVFAAAAHSKNLDLVLSMDRAVPSRVRGDGGRLRQIVWNLLSNAVKFTDRGEIVCEVRLLEQCEDWEMPTLRVEIRDTGIGVPPEAHNKLFTSFTQADSSTTRRFGGTGLGLTICKRLVELMGGEIGFESVAGQGSTFWFTCRFRSTRDHAAALEPPPILSGKRVLVVDDCETNRRVLENQLSYAGMIVRTVASGSQALESLRRDGPSDICIVDMDLQEMGGTQFASDLGAACKLVALTSIGSRATADDYSAKFDAFLSKPARASVLYECLAGLFSCAMAERRSKKRDEWVFASVLVAEDNPANQKVVSAMLRKMGCSVHLVPNGAEAVAAAGSASYDIILMDCQMPVMDGFEASTRILRSRREPDGPPIIALTANAVDGDRDHCLAAGMNDYLTKPVTREKLQNMLSKWLGRRNGSAQPAVAPNASDAMLRRVQELIECGLTTSEAIELIDSFLSDTAVCMNDLKPGSPAVEDRDRLARVAHRIAGSSANMGLCALEQAVRRVETSCRGGVDRSAWESMLPQVQEEYVRGCESLLQLRARLQEEQAVGA